MKFINFLVKKFINFLAKKFINFLAIPSKPFALVFDFPLCSGTNLIKIAVYHIMAKAEPSHGSSGWTLCIVYPLFWKSNALFSSISLNHSLF